MPFPVEEEYIQQTEAALSVKFPTSYRAKMLDENGGEISTADDDWQLFPFLDSSDRKRFSRTCNDLVSEGKKAFSAPGFPANAIAIAENGAGDYLAFIRSNGDQLSEEVFVWRHETRQLEKIANSFRNLGS